MMAITHQRHVAPAVRVHRVAGSGRVAGLGRVADSGRVAGMDHGTGMSEDPDRLRLSPMLWTGAILMSLLNAGMFVLVEGFTVRGLALVAEGVFGFLAFLVAMTLTELDLRRRIGR